jgi:SAM-dependent methyltransferase
VNPYDAMYAAGTPPWEVGAPQSAIVRLARERAFAGRVIDLGCGSGENTLHLANEGLQTLGIDLATRAVQRARAKAVARDLRVEFRVHDALELQSLATTFDTFLDCAMFHLLSDAGRYRYERSLASAAHIGSRLFILCMSEHEPEWGGPRRVTKRELHELFEARWVIERIDESVVQTRLHEDGAHGWLLRATFVGCRSRLAS